MTRKYLIWLAPILTVLLAGAGCAKKAAENTIEKTIKNTANVNAQVDLSNNSIKANINGTSLVAGTSVPLPTNFPTDVYVIDGTIKTAVATPGVGFNVALTTVKTMTEAKALYEQHFATDGWTITTNGVIDTHSAALIAIKGTRTVTVAISDKESPTVVTVTVTERTTTAPTNY